MANEIITKRDALSAQGMFVVKGNDLIQKSRYSLSLMEQKAILFVISKIKPHDEPQTEYIFNIKDFCKACNLYENTGFYYQYVREIMEHLGEHLLKVQLPDGKEMLSHWFSGAILDREAGEVRLHFDPYLKPYLFELKAFYTQYSLEYVLPMKSKYGIRLYEFLRSVQTKDYKQMFTVEEIKQRIDCEKYDKFKDFRVNVLEPALEDINTYTDLEVRCTPHKTGRKYTHLEFVILTHHDNEQERFYKRRQELGWIR